MRHSKHSISAPQSLDEASALLGEIGQLESELEQIKIDLKSEIAFATSAAVEKSTPIKDELDEKLTALEVYATAHKTTLIPDPKKKKSVTVPTGVFGWRTGNWCPIFKSKEILLATLEKLGLGKYIKTIKELDLQGLVKDRDKLPEIPGLTFDKPERFYATPNKPKAVTEEPKPTAATPVV